MKIGIVGGTGNISQPIVRLLLERERCIPNSDGMAWEDEIIEKQKRVTSNA